MTSRAQRHVAGIAVWLASPRAFRILFGVALAANLLPLVVTPYLPFSDLHGHASLLGALNRTDDPQAGIQRNFAIQIDPLPNVFFFAVTWLFTRVMTVQAATNLYVALFCVSALPLAMLYTLRSFGRSPWLAFLGVALAYHRGVWFGFVNSVTSTALFILVLGLANESFTRRQASWRDAALAAALFAIATAHAFILLCAALVIVAWALLATGRPSPLWRRLAVLLPSALYLGPWLAEALSRPGKGSAVRQGFFEHLWHRRLPLRQYFVDLHQWLLNGLAGRADDLLAGVFGVTLLACLFFGVRPPAGPSEADAATPQRTDDRLWRVRLPLVAAGLGLGYFGLPMSTFKPFYWWAVNVRLLVPFLLVLALLERRRPTRFALGPRAFLPLALASIAYAGYLAYDFRTWFFKVELAGFQQALNVIPKGKRVHAVYPPFKNERHYSHFPMAQLVGYYVVHRGGLAHPMMDGHLSDQWVALKVRPPRAVWGRVDAFYWELYGEYWDYFLVKQPAPGNGKHFLPFADAPDEAVTRIYSKGLWSVWRRNGPGLPLPEEEEPDIWDLLTRPEAVRSARARRPVNP